MTWGPSVEIKKVVNNEDAILGKTQACLDLYLTLLSSDMNLFIFPCSWQKFSHG